jgi:UTP--glucose-1-phosphate uridylyltransferase
LLGDDLIDERDQLLSTMLSVHDEKQSHVIALMEVDPETIHLYGCAEVEGDGDVVRVKNLVEKPETSKAPSNLAVIGRYVLRPEIFNVLENTAPGRGNEIQITDALQSSCVSDSEPEVYGVVFRGRRYDTGDKVDYIKASLRLAVDREDIGQELKQWLKEFSKGL